MSCFYLYQVTSIGTPALFICWTKKKLDELTVVNSPVPINAWMLECTDIRRRWLSSVVMFGQAVTAAFFSFFSFLRVFLTLVLFFHQEVLNKIQVR